MLTALLVIIYLAFISLGLPDGLLGGAWPSMYLGFGVDVGSQGIASMIIAGGTIVSSLMSERIIRKLGTGLVTVISVAMTAIALFGISRSGNFLFLCLWAVPLGLGAGSVDSALNNFVALHYKATHMNWLHCFWGVGAAIGPVILGHYLGLTGAWRDGYSTVSIIQFALVAILLISFPLWKKVGSREQVTEVAASKPIGIRKAISLPGAKPTLVAFFCYCAIETTVGLWGSTFLVKVRDVTEATAASWISLFYIGITVGRLLSGFMSMKLRSIQMLYLGLVLIAAGILVLMLPVSGWPMLIGLFLIGLGCAPIFPTLLHETPRSFGKANSQSLMGIQMATAYVGTTLIPPIFGGIGGQIGYVWMPPFLLLLLALMTAMTLRLYRVVKSNWEQ